MTILRLLARQTRLPGATDAARDGEGPRVPPFLILTHHVANISTAIQAAPTPQTILNAAAHATRLRMGSCKVCVSERAGTVP